MLTNKDKRYGKKRKRLWDIFGWSYYGIANLSKRHSVNCGCGMCKAKTFYNRYENKQNRLKVKQDIKKELNNEI